MEELFLSVLNMSLTASYVSLFVILIRLPLKKVPKVISYALWSVVAFRSLCPFSFEGTFSFLPQTSMIIPQEISYHQITQINNNATASDTLVNRSPSLVVTESGAIPLETYTQVGTYLWLLGVAAMLVYSIVSIVLLKKKLKNSQHIQLNIYEADNLKTPFVLGIFRPRIFIPTGLGAEEKAILSGTSKHIFAGLTI